MDAPQAVTKKQPEKIWTRDFVLICLANFFIFLGFQMTLPTLPLFVKELGGSDQLVGIIVGIFTFSALLMRPYAGHALESKGRRFVYMFGLAVFVISVGSFAFVTSIVFLLLIRILQGIGWGFSTTATGTIATDIIPEKRRGEGMGYFGLSGNIALAFGPSLGLTLVDVITFPQLFLICASGGLVAFILSSRIRYKQVEESKDKTVTMKFDIFEKTAIQPALLLFFITFTFGGIATFLPLHAAEKSIAGIESYFLVYAVFLMISRTFAGKIYDQKGHIYVFLPGTVFIFGAMLLLAWLPNTFVMLIAAGMYGLGFGSVQPALQAWAVEKAPGNRKGMANATFFSFFDLGVGLGAIIFGQIASVFNYAVIYLTAGGSVLLSVLLYLYLLFMAIRRSKQSHNI
ncbi:MULTISPECIES: MFS transporter [Virgibacillus]|uniref:Bacillibactin exporter n=1 Tax=Virgibacillus massiliensis TaxID=1462526 RepID=A0A024Q8B8_9BACI|nr:MULTISPECIES: MFS transporter [Virgibacillus]EQB38307.1 MFS transporter [Virgibacillus sp. CM-4]MYL41012.1 MFS transporter [Virgibacillus massiliensis]CDQ38186.1 Bacillibactin exporter [Virgibacillus massiliensis]